MSCCDPSSDMSAKVTETPATKNSVGTGYAVQGSEELRYSYSFVDDIFDANKDDLASQYQKWGRVLCVLDDTVHSIYGSAIESYFGTYKIPVTFHVFKGGELNKNMDTFEGMVDAFDQFGLIRKEPVLVVGGGLASDVCGYACASYRRSTNWIRVGTTLIALIDAAISIKVGINHGKLKNRLGAYHAPAHTFLDFNFLKTLPEGQIRNGFAEIVKISHVAHKPTWDLLVKYGPDLVTSGFGRKESNKAYAAELKEAADTICRSAIKVMLDLESPNLHEIGLDRVIASGHAVSPTLELAPFPPLRHGHAITVDMAWSVTLAHSRGYVSDAERDEFFDTVTGVGLTIDHELFDDKLMMTGVAAILKTRDGLLRLAVPKPLGTCHFINDYTDEELKKSLATHKQYINSRYPQTKGGAGIDGYADAGDLGADPAELKRKQAEALAETGVGKAKKAAVNGNAKPHVGGVPPAVSSRSAVEASA
ncbi:unnamed protein product [Sympodiomycopsis kandeliae]